MTKKTLRAKIENIISLIPLEDRMDFLMTRNEKGEYIDYNVYKKAENLPLEGKFIIEFAKKDYNGYFPFMEDNYFKEIELYGPYHKIPKIWIANEKKSSKGINKPWYPNHIQLIVRENEIYLQSLKSNAISNIKTVICKNNDNDEFKILYEEYFKKALIKLMIQKMISYKQDYNHPQCQIIFETEKCKEIIIDSFNSLNFEELHPDYFFKDYLHYGPIKSKKYIQIK